MRFRKGLGILLAVMLLAAVVAGCSSTPAESSSSESSGTSSEANGSSGSESSSGGGSSSGGSVYWLNGKPEADEAFQNLAAMYKEATGTDVKVVTAAAGTYEQTLSSELGKSAPPTLFVIGTSQGVKDWGGYALDLNDTPIANELSTDAYNMYDSDGKLVSIGYCYECFGIIVNPDLVEKAGYNVDDIKNFETLKTVVEDIHARADELGFNAFTSNDMDSSSSWRFTGHLANIDYYYEQNGEKWTECPPTITGEYLPNYKNLYDLAINNSTVQPNELATGGHDAEAEFKNGEAAFWFNGSWEWAAATEGVPNAVMIPYYCGVEGEEMAGLNCGTEQCWAINSQVSEADQQATMDFMVWCVTDPDALAILVNELGVIPYKSAPASENGFLANAEQYEKDGHYVMNWAFNFEPNVEDYRQALVSALNQYDNDQSDENWGIFETAFVQGWANQYQAANA